MKTMKKIAIVTIAMLSIFTASVFGSETEKRKPMGRHNGPPPEAYTACEGKSAGDSAEFVSPRGDTVTGTCELQGDRLVLRPDNPPERNSDRRNQDNDSIE